MLADALARTPPPSRHGRFLKLFYATMTDDHPPTCRLFVNDPELCPPSYQNYLIAALRAQFGLNALPLRLELRARSRRQ